MENKIFKLDPLFELDFLKTQIINNNNNQNICISPVIFQSVNDIFYLIYVNCKNSIISYDINNNEQICEIKGLDKNIQKIIYYFDSVNKRDLIITISLNSLMILNILNLEILSNIRINDSFCFLKYNNNNYILIFNEKRKGKSVYINVFDFKGNKIKEINISSMTPYIYTYFIEAYYDIKLNKYFFIFSSKKYLISYDYNTDKTFIKYKKGISKIKQIIIYDDKITKLLGRIDKHNKILIWDFHSGNLLNTIEVLCEIRNILLWNEKYFFVTSNNGNIQLSGILTKNFKTGGNSIRTITKIFHQKYGECLISLNYSDNINEKMKIEIWASRKNINIKI